MTAPEPYLTMQRSIIAHLEKHNLANDIDRSILQWRLVDPDFYGWNDRDRCFVTRFSISSTRFVFDEQGNWLCHYEESDSEVAPALPEKPAEPEAKAPKDGFLSRLLKV